MPIVLAAEGKGDVSIYPVSGLSSTLYKLFYLFSPFRSETAENAPTRVGVRYH